MTESSSRRSSAWRIFAIPAALALGGYLLLYGCDDHLRHRRGPWEVQFFQESEGTPAVRITQPALGITPVTIRFQQERLGPEPNALPKVIRFDHPRPSLPFGTTVFDDLMYLPGTVVFQCFGHEVQLLPRALFLNRHEHPWREVPEQIDLSPADKLESPAPSAAGRGADGGGAN